MLSWEAHTTNFISFLVTCAQLENMLSYVKNYNWAYLYKYGTHILILFFIPERMEWAKKLSCYSPFKMPKLECERAK